MSEDNYTVPIYPEEAGQYEESTKLIWKIYFYSDENPNGADLTSEAEGEESLVSQIQQRFQQNLSSVGPDVALSYKFGYGGEVRPVHQDGESMRDNWLGRANNVTKLFGEKARRPIWSLKIVFTLPPTTDQDGPGDLSSHGETKKVDTIQKVSSQQVEPIQPFDVWRQLKEILFDRLEEVLEGVVQLIDSEASAGVVANYAFAYLDKYGRAADPNNWGGGGPGGWPLFPSLPDNASASYYFDFYGASQGINDLRNINNRTGNGVKVVILDTCPSETQWTAAVSKWASSTTVDPHPLLKALNNHKANGKFHMYRVSDKYAMSASEFARAQNSPPVNYDVVDHGIFIAGIVHTIAPNAEIHLVQVMTDQGVLLINPIEDAISDFIFEKMGEQQPIIINCSLNYELPLEELETNRISALKSDSETEMVALKYSGDTAGIQAFILAASGNEGHFKDRPNGQKPPYPKFPAAFESVMGIAALKNDNERTGYSNWADDFDLQIESEFPGGSAPTTERMGIATNGGNVSAVVYTDPDGNLSSYGFTDVMDHLLGLYISDTFTVKLASGVTLTLSNPHGWAYWSGTSFSTGIVTGVSALVAEDLNHSLGRLPSAEEIRQALKLYCQAPTPNMPEYVLHTQQISPPTS